MAGITKVKKHNQTIRHVGQVVLMWFLTRSCDFGYFITFAPYFFHKTLENEINN